jgi:uncharacterized DUF497 family protein
MSDDIIYKGRFIWNRNKAETNRKKHPGMTFEKGSEAYDDLLAVEEYDEENSVYEDRYNRTGIVGDAYITVSFTLRNNLARIFSVREADEEEGRAYDEHVRRYIGER